MSLYVQAIATDERPRAMLPTAAARTLSEVLLAAAAATLATAELAIKTEVATPDQILILWCIIGGFLGAFCSLRFFPVQGNWENGWQLAVNLILSATFSPTLCHIIVAATPEWIGISVGLRLALPVSVTVGAVAQAVVFALIPWGKKYLDARASKIVDGESEKSTT